MTKPPSVQDRINAINKGQQSRKPVIPPPAVKSDPKPKKETRAKASGSNERPSRANRQQIAGWFSSETGKTLRLIALEQDLTIQALLEESLRATFKKYGKDWKE